MGHTIKVCFHRSTSRQGIQANLNSVAKLRSPRTVVMLAAAAPGVLTLPEVTLLLLRLVATHPGAVVMLVVVLGRLVHPTDVDVGTSVSLTKRDFMGHI
jgi:hypothetical protein